VFDDEGGVYFFSFTFRYGWLLFQRQGLFAYFFGQKKVRERKNQSSVTSNINPASMDVQKNDFGNFNMKLLNWSVRNFNYTKKL
jgi:hypothetical protein